VAASLLAACGGGQPPIGAPGAMPQSQAIAGAAVRFEPIGPTHMGGTQDPTSGKVNAFAVDPTNAKIIYMASGATSPGIRWPRHRPLDDAAQTTNK
jgi:hypothetical protein